MYMNSVEQEIMEKVERISSTVDELKSLMYCIQNDLPYDSIWFTEDADPIAAASSLLSRIVEHLLKIKYSTISTHKNKWKKEINTVFKLQIRKKLKIGNDNKIPKNAANKLQSDLQKIYDLGIDSYKDDSREYENLVWGLQYIPDECPWETFNELIFDDIDELLEKLPYPEDDE